MTSYWQEQAHRIGADRAAWDDDRDDTARHAAIITAALPAGRWLDVGVGPGRVASQLPDVIGVDLCPAMTVGCPVPHLTVAASGVTPFADDAFDGAYSMLVFQHLPDAQVRAWLAEMCRVVRPGGGIVAQHTVGDARGLYDYQRTADAVAAMLDKLPVDAPLVVPDPIEPAWAWTFAHTSTG